MQGDFNLADKTLQFIIGGRYSFFVQNDGDYLRIKDHDNHTLMKFGYDSVPLTAGGDKFATATPPTEYDLPLVAGVVNIPGGYKSTYGKDQFGKVIINLFLDHTDGSAFKTWHEVLANLPTGYRPTQTVNVVGVATSNASSSPIGFSVLPDGTIRIYPFSVTETRVTATFVFQAGN